MKRSSALGGSTSFVDVANLFGKAPAFNGATGYDILAGDPSGCVVTVGLWLKMYYRGGGAAPQRRIFEVDRPLGKAWIVAAIAIVPLAAFADDSFQFRLSPGPRLVGTRAMSSGSGEVSVSLSGSTLSLDGKYEGLLDAPAKAQLSAGPAPGVRGPKIADLTISPGASGSLSGKVKLTAKQLALLRKGGLYIEIDSPAAPEGDLWGWLLPFKD